MPTSIVIIIIIIIITIIIIIILIATTALLTITSTISIANKSVYRTVVLLRVRFCFWIMLSDILLTLLVLAVKVAFSCLPLVGFLL